MDTRILLAIAAALALGAGVGYGALRLSQPERMRVVEADYTRFGVRGNVFYTDSRCAYCRDAAAWLDARGVRYEQRVIDRSDAARREFAKLGQAGVPVLVNERVLVLGFDPAIYQTHFGKRGTTTPDR